MKDFAMSYYTEIRKHFARKSEYANICNSYPYCDKGPEKIGMKWLYVILFAASSSNCSSNQNKDRFTVFMTE